MAHARAQFRRRYTDKQKAALLHAVLIEDVAVTKAVKLAAEGNLGGLPAFHLNLKSAYAIKRNERADFEQHNAVAMAKGSDDATVKLWAKLIKHARELERADKVDPDEFKRVAVALAAIKRAMGDQAKPAKATAKDRPDEPPSDDGGVLAKLLGDDKGPRGGGPLSGAAAEG